jgi:hypothetical protein
MGCTENLSEECAVETAGVDVSAYRRLVCVVQTPRQSHVENVEVKLQGSPRVVLDEFETAVGRNLLFGKQSHAENGSAGTSSDVHSRGVAGFL